MSLAVILDLNLAAWHHVDPSSGNSNREIFEHSMQSLAFFLKSHLVMTDRVAMSADLSSASTGQDDLQSDLILLGAGINNTLAIYPPQSEKPSPADLEQSVYGPVALFDHCYRKGLAQVLNGYDYNNNGSLCNPSISQSISKALCYLNAIYRHKKHMSGQHSGGSRILIVSVSKDDPQTYVSLMNSIFSAQKLNIPINVCRLKSSVEMNGDAVFLKQASYLTGGIYVEVDDYQQLMQHLMTYFLVKEHLDSDMSLSSVPLNQQSHLPSISKNPKTLTSQQAVQQSYFKQLRSWLSSDMGRQVDFRAACFCHKRIVDVGFICSVCLAIYCEAFHECSTCGIKIASPS